MGMAERESGIVASAVVRLSAFIPYFQRVSCLSFVRHGAPFSA